MRYLTIVSNLGYRGTQRAAQNYTLGMSARGHQVAILALNGGGIREEFLRQKGVTVWVGGDLIEQALERASEFNAEVIHIHRQGGHYPIWGTVLRKLKIQGVRVLETNVFGKVDYSNDASLVDVHLHISRWCLYRWRRWLGRKTEVGAYLPYAVDLDAFPAVDAASRHGLRCSLGLPNASFVCGRIGKWHPCVFEAFVALVQRCPDALLLNVLDHTDAHRYAAQLPAGVFKRIVPIPVMLSDSALSLFYGSLDCLLQVAPAGESFGMVLAEAMACGTPVVTASMPHKDNAQVEVVGHMEGGIVSGSAAKLGEGLVMFYEDASLQNACSTRCRRLISDRFDLATICEKLENIAHHALASQDRDDLVKRLQGDGGIEMEIDRLEIEQSLEATLDGPSAVELALMRVVHNPIIYRVYNRLRYGKPDQKCAF